MFNPNLIISEMKETKGKSTLNKRVLFSLSMLLLFVGALTAQVKTVTGVVKDQTGEEVIAATVLVKGTTIGTVTDINGVYRIEVPANAKTLVFSYVGMQPQEVAITGSVINVTLKDDSQMLD